MKFRNTPDQPIHEESDLEKKVKEEEKKEEEQKVEEIQKRKYSKRITVEQPRVGYRQKIKNIIFWGLLGFFILYFGSKAIGVLIKVQRVYSEVVFTVDHSAVVKPIRELYEGSHQKTDDEIIDILQGKN